jgi:hypothetical protein
MNQVLEEIKKLRKDVDEIRQREERRRGRLEQLMKTGKEDFGVESLQEGEAKLAKIAEQNLEDEKNLQAVKQKLEAIVTKAKESMGK